MKTNLQYFFYFYRYLRYRLIITFFVSLFVGLLDGIGLALFIPLLKLVTTENTGSASSGDVISQFVVQNLQVSPTLLNILLLILLFFTLKGAAKFVEGFIRVRYQQNFMRQIRISNIDLLSDYDYKNFVEADAGRIQNTFTGEVNKVNTAFRYYFKAYQYGILLVVYVAMALYADLVFSLMVVTGGVLSNFLFRSLYKRTKRLSTKLTGENHIFQDLLIQKVSFFKYLKTTGLHGFYAGKLKKNIRLLERLQKKIGLIDALLAALREPVVILIIIIAIYLQVAYFDQDVGLIFLSLLLLYRALTFFMAMQEQWNFFLGYSGSLDNMDQFTRELRAGKEENGNESLQDDFTSLELRKATFFYHEIPVLKDINLKIHKHEMLAIVGESGAGKSTLMSVISGLFYPSQGKCLVNGVDLEELDRGSWRKQIGYIPQDVNIFNDTIYNNVTFWAEKSDSNKKRFLDVVRKAAVYDFMMELPKGEDTMLGNNGIKLSGGQKQRLAIARELFKKVHVLLMDEATSALDGGTESVVKQNLESFKGKLTLCIIAHRLATIKHADKIVVLRKGAIVDTGTYDELLQRNPEFQDMVAYQNL